MSYQEEVAKTVLSNKVSIEGDLQSARLNFEASKSDCLKWERAVVGLEALLTFERDADYDSTGASGEKMTLHVAMQRVLETAPKRMMRAGELAAEVERRRLYRMRDGRAVEPQQIHARAGNYPEVFTREGTFIKLK